MLLEQCNHNIILKKAELSCSEGLVVVAEAAAIVQDEGMETARVVADTTTRRRDGHLVTLN